MDGSYIRMAVGQESTENEPGGLQSFKPEGEGETDASEGLGQLLKSPVHGEGTATTAF